MSNIIQIGLTVIGFLVAILGICYSINFLIYAILRQLGMLQDFAEFLYKKYNK